MSDMDNQHGRTERDELTRLGRALRGNATAVSRRDLLRWSAIAAGAVATARFGPEAVAASSDAASRASTARYHFQDQAAEIEQNVTIQVPFNPFGVDVTLDPHRSPNWGPLWVMFPNVWGGLVRYTETGKVELDLAESYEKSDDGLVYTFKIRPDAKYANGRQVVADHFVQSWLRALDTADLSPMAQFMEQVKGYQDLLDGISPDIGFRVVDDATVEITLSEPYNFFLSYLAAFVWNVVDPEALVRQGELDFVLRDSGTGPWRFTRFDPATEILMEPNPNHYGGVSPSIVQIVWPILIGPTAESDAFNLYKEDRAVIADLPLSLKESAEQDPAVSQEMKRIEPSGSVRWVGMDFTKPPFDDVRVRRAFGMAIDRARWSEEIWQGTWAPAEVFTPPIVTTTGAYQPPAGMTFNADEAKQLLADAGFPEGEGLPEIVYYEPSTDTPEEIDRWAAFLGLIQEVLGVEIRHDTSQTQQQIDNLRTDNGGLQFDVQWFWNITETPRLMDEVFRTDSPYMQGVFNWKPDLEPKGDFDPGADAQTFDGLMIEAEVEQDEARRNELYRQGEELLLKNAVCVPLGNPVQMYVQKPYLQGTKQGAWTGALPVWFDKEVVVLKRDPATATATT